MDKMKLGADLAAKPRNLQYFAAELQGMVINRLVLGVMTAALLVSSALLWSMKAPPLIAGVSVFGAAGYLLAAYLGWRLSRAIRKSGAVNSEAQPCPCGTRLEVQIRSPGALGIQ